MILYYLMLLLMAFYQYVHLPVMFGLTLVKIIGLLAVLAAVLGLPNLPGSLYMFRWAESRLFFVLLSIIAASSLITAAKENVVPSLMWSYLSHAGFLFATMVFLSSLKRVQTSCYVLLASMIVAALSCFKDYVRWHVSRPGGITGDPNYHALVVLCLLPMCFLLFPGNTVAKKTFLSMTGVLSLGSFLLAASRGGLIGLGLSLAYTLLRIHRRILYLVAVPFIMLVLVAVLPHAGFERFAEEGPAGQASVEDRLRLWQAGWNMVKSHPFLGVGAGMFRGLSQEYNRDVRFPQLAHNTYIELAAETGLPSLALFLAILWRGWRRARHQARELRLRGEPMAAQIASSIEVGLVGFSVAALFLSAAYIRHFWILVFFGLAIERILLVQPVVGTLASVPSKGARLQRDRNAHAARARRWGCPEVRRK